MLLSKVNLDISRAQPGQIGNVRNNSLVSNPAAAEIPIATSDAIRRPTSQVKARQDPDIADRLALARHAEARAHALARDIRTLTAWLGHDVLALAGPSLEIRQDLFDFIATEMKRREADDPRRIRPVRMALQNQRDNLLAFAGVLDDQFAAIARVHVLPEPLVREACVLHRKPRTSSAYWQGWNRLRARMGASVSPCAITNFTAAARNSGVYVFNFISVLPLISLSNGTVQKSQSTSGYYALSLFVQQSRYAASSSWNSTCRPALAAIFTSASIPNRLILPRIRSDTRG